MVTVVSVPAFVLRVLTTTASRIPGIVTVAISSPTKGTLWAVASDQLESNEGIRYEVHRAVQPHNWVMGNDSERSGIVAAFKAWSDREGNLYDRLPDLENMAAPNPDAWAEAILSVVPEAPTDEWPSSLYWGLIAVLRVAPDRAAMEAELARRAHANRTVASVVGAVLRFGNKGVGELHAIDVLGEDFVFDTWSRLQRNWKLEDRGQQKPEFAVDFWAWEVMDSLGKYDGDALWGLFLRYLEHERDPRCRSQAGIAWLEDINYMYAPQFIDRIEDETKTNVRLREAMRATYPPLHHPEVARRFTDAMQEPPN